MCLCHKTLVGPKLKTSSMDSASVPVTGATPQAERWRWCVGSGQSVGEPRPVQCLGDLPGLMARLVVRHDNVQ